MRKGVDINIKQTTTGVFLFVLFNTIVKFVVYPTIIYFSKNNFVGLFFMFLASFILRYLLILIYDLIKKDWLLIESLKARRGNRENHITRRIKKLKELGNIFLILTLVFTDSVLTVLYLRRGYFDWNGIKGIDIKILFTISNLIGIVMMGVTIRLIFNILRAILS